jgi:hypothetical protein
MNFIHKGVSGRELDDQMFEVQPISILDPTKTNLCVNLSFQEHEELICQSSQFEEVALVHIFSTTRRKQ